MNTVNAIGIAIAIGVRTERAESGATKSNERAARDEHCVAEAELPWPRAPGWQQGIAQAPPGETVLPIEP